MKKTFPSEAFRFTAPAQIAPASDTGDRAFEGVAYAGGIITDHWMAPVAFDLATMTAEAPLPVLFCHDDDDAVGVADKIEINTGLNVSGRLFSSIDDDAKSISDKADRGFPWGLSVRIIPGSIEEVAAGVDYTLNGAPVKGPLTILKNSTIREVSFCSVAADRDTCADVFSQSQQITVEVESMPDTKNPDDRVAVLEAQVADLTAKFSASEVKVTEAEARATAAEAKAAAAEAELQRVATESRQADVKALFSAIGREWSDEAGAPYMSLPGAVFSQVSADLKAAKSRTLPDSLFKDTATGGDQAQAVAFSAPAGFGVDQAALEKHAKALEYQRKNPGVDYITAVKAVEAV